MVLEKKLKLLVLLKIKLNIAIYRDYMTSKNVVIKE